MPLAVLYMCYLLIFCHIILLDVTLLRNVMCPEIQKYAAHVHVLECVDNTRVFAQIPGAPGLAHEVIQGLYRIAYNVSPRAPPGLAHEVIQGLYRIAYNVSPRAPPGLAHEVIQGLYRIAYNVSPRAQSLYIVVYYII